MSEFSELIKSFSKSREYVRDFFVYGFKTRENFNGWSGRTYDTERRRLESWLPEYVKQDYTEKGKNIYLAIDSNLLSTNPLYRVWKAKSFTDNDIKLHFYILDYLEANEPQTAEEITDGILESYDIFYDAQMVRRKCNEYADEGLLIKEKQGKKILYGIDDNIRETLSQSIGLMDSLKFYQLNCPLGIVGSTLMDNLSVDNDLFGIKHNFFVHTLEDEVLYTILEGIKSKRNITIEIKSTKTDNISTLTCTPLSIIISTRTGRRFLCCYDQRIKHFKTPRLDAIKSVSLEAACESYDELKSKEFFNRQYLWGVSFLAKSDAPVSTVKLTLSINEHTEDFILNRLEREGKNGMVTKIADNTFTYETKVLDVNEMIPWIRTFIGRIIDIETDNEIIKQKFKRDLRAMYKMYLSE